MKLKMLFVDAGGIIQGPVPMDYPLGLSLSEFVKTLVPDYATARSLIFFIPEHEGPVETINDENLRGNGCLHVVCSTSSAHFDFDVVRSFLEDGCFLETGVRLASVTSEAFPLDRLGNYKGVAHFEISKTANIETLEFSYYRDRAVFHFSCDINGIVGAEGVRDMERPVPMRFLKDVADEDVDHEFEDIESALCHDGNFLVEVSSPQGTRELLTFQRDGKSLAYRNTGNRVLPRTLFERVPLPHLDIGYARGTSVKSLIEIMGGVLISFKSQGLEVCDIEAPFRGDYNFLTWDEASKEAGIYHVSPDAPRAKKPRTRVFTNQKPCALAWLDQLQAFVLSLEGSSELYLIDPAYPEIELGSQRDISPLFAAKGDFANYGSVMELYSRRYGDSDLILTVQKRRIGLSIVREFPG